MSDILALWSPVFLVVGADVLYQVCAKKMSSHAAPLAALASTYLVSALLCAILYEVLVPDSHIWAALSHISIPALAVGVCIAGLEVGTIYLYRAGWAMNVGFIVYTALIVVVLLIIGSVFYHDPLSTMKLAGVVLTCVGMGLIVR